MKMRTTMITMTTVLGMLALGAASVVQAQTDISFNGGSLIDKTDWHDQANWSLGEVPGPEHRVTIGTSYDVSLSAGGIDTRYEIHEFHWNNLPTGSSLTIKDKAHLEAYRLGWGPHVQHRFVFGGVLTISGNSSLHTENSDPTYGNININGGQWIDIGVNLANSSVLLNSLTLNVTAGGLFRAYKRLSITGDGGGINIEGGTVVAETLSHQNANAPITFVLGGPVGKLILTGATDQTEYIQGLMDNGRIIDGQVAWGAYSYDEMGTNGSMTTREGNGTIITAAAAKPPGILLLFR